MNPVVTGLPTFNPLADSLLSTQLPLPANINDQQHIPTSLPVTNTQFTSSLLPNLPQQVPSSTIPQTQSSEASVRSLPVDVADTNQQQPQNPTEASEEIYEPKNKLPPVTQQFINATISLPAQRLYLSKPEQFETNVRNLFTGNILTAFSNGIIQNIDTFTGEVSVEWTMKADEIANGVITPWTLELVKQQADLRLLLNESRTTLPIRVVCGNNQYIHELTEEFMFGILTVLRDEPLFSFYFEDTIKIVNNDTIPITIDDLIDNYIGEHNQMKYTATVRQQTVKFNTPIFVQGIITAAGWLNKSPYDYISDLKEGQTQLRF